MNPQAQFCQNSACHASGRVGGGNIVIHSQKQKRYKCKCCGKTFTERKGTAVYGLKKSVELFELVVTLLAFGCPVQAIVAACGLDERTVLAWQLKAGRHCQGVHEHIVGQSQLDLVQVQADELRVKTQFGVVWMAMAMMVSTRLWLGGAVSPRRDKALIARLVEQVRQVALGRPLLLAVDGLTSYVGAFQRAFRSPLPTGKPGRPRQVAWPHIHIVRVIKRRSATGFSVERLIAQGSASVVETLIVRSQGQGVINTAFIERLNATFRQNIRALTRRTRSLARTQPSLEAAMYLQGSLYNFCTLHRSLRQPLLINAQGRQRFVLQSPAIAAGLTDHLWSVRELLLFKVPVLYEPPKRRGRPKKLACSCPFL